MMLSPHQLQALMITVGVFSTVLYSAFTMTLFLLFSSTKMFSAPDSVSVIFTAGQKSLSSGIPLIQSIVATQSLMSEDHIHRLGGMRERHATSLMILPLIIYHTVQLIVGGMFVQSFRKYVATAASNDHELPQLSPTKSKDNLGYTQPAAFESSKIN